MEFGEEDPRDKVLFSSRVSREGTVNKMMTVDVDLFHWTEIVRVKFLHCEVTLFAPRLCFLRRRFPGPVHTGRVGS